MEAPHAGFGFVLEVEVVIQHKQRHHLLRLLCCQAEARVVERAKITKSGQPHEPHASFFFGGAVDALSRGGAGGSGAGAAHTTIGVATWTETPMVH
jgi:hypothetical protein